jgi:3-hydroxyacyl-CoA dehydrogenase
MFFAERQTTKIPDVPEDTPTREVKKAAVIGAGTMGGGHHDESRQCGHSDDDHRDESRMRSTAGLATIRMNYAGTVSRGRLKQEEMDRRMSLITPSLDLSAARDADIVIEAVFERMDVKQDIFRKLDAIAKPGAILASNTSTLDVDQIAAVTKRPQDVIGTHFFSPANVMRLLEVVRGKQTGKDVLATTMKLGKAIKKVPVVSGVCDGFIGNRMIEKYGQQSLFLIDEGLLAAAGRRSGAEMGASRWGRSPWATWRGSTSAGRSASAATSSGRTSSTRRSPTRSPSAAASARRPARGGTCTSRAAASRFRIRRSSTSSPTTARRPASRRGRSPMTRSSSG